MNGFCELILGGARSGKSKLAEQRALASGKECIYLATAEAGDQEMARRIEHHQQRRGNGWLLVEEPVALTTTLLNLHRADRCIVVDCLTLWVSNCLHRQCWTEQSAAFLQALPSVQGHLILVSNETGMGLVAMEELSRRFVDESGFLHQALAEQCQRVTLTVAGLPLQLKPSP